MKRHRLMCTGYFIYIGGFTMQLISVHSKEFEKYGKVLTGYDVSALLDAMNKIDLPAEGVAYEPGIDSLEACTDLYKDFTDRAYGGMPIQIGMCWGRNTKLNCLEYHRGSELNIGTTSFVLLLAKAEDIHDGKLDTKDVVAFKADKGDVVLVYEDSLHYAPCQEMTDSELPLFFPREPTPTSPLLKKETTRTNSSGLAISGSSLIPRVAKLLPVLM